MIWCSGLIVDFPVELHGVEVGKVTRIELADPYTVAILLRITSEAPVSKATVATQSPRAAWRPVASPVTSTWPWRMPGPNWSAN